MTEQLYKIKPYFAGEDGIVVYTGWHCGDAKRLVPVPAPHTLAWALGEMVAHPMREYKHADSNVRYRFNRFLEMFIFGEWTVHVILNDIDLTSTSWSPCEAELPRWTPEPQPEFPHAEEGVDCPDEEIEMFVSMEPKRGAAFTAHLQKASETVQKWPAWKQEILGGEATQPQAAPTLEQPSEVTDFWWALRQMYNNPMREYEASPGPDHGAPWIRFRYHQMNGALESLSGDAWEPSDVTNGMLSWTNWREHVLPMAAPVLTLEQRVDAIAADVAELKMFMRADGLLFRVEQLERRLDTNYGPIGVKP